MRISDIKLEEEAETIEDAFNISEKRKKQILGLIDSFILEKGRPAGVIQKICLSKQLSPKEKIYAVFRVGYYIGYLLSKQKTY